ncbi:MAG: YchJ family metal-binding protein [Pseudomonadota bacterium]
MSLSQVLEGRVGENNGEVTFVARYKINGRAFKHREKSRFCRYSDRWMYLHGETLDG